jgi:tRNA modification GTPase
VYEGSQKIVPTDDTIVAISTPLGRSGIGVVRISGPHTNAIATRLLKSASPLVIRRASVVQWLDEQDIPIDEVVATLFGSPNSYTGEDILELSAHGNPVTLQRIVNSVCAAGARIAAPGEFTMRAVLNGKMDLIQAEAVRSFVEAQTTSQARTAMLQIGGALSKRVVPEKDKLLDIIARLEAGIDFAEDDVSVPNGQEVSIELDQIQVRLGEIGSTYTFGKILFEGVRLAIIGKPNVGKSSLFNQFVGFDRAIVTEIPGTTRDVLSERICLDGIPLRFSDTAGVRQATDVVEQLGVQKTLEEISEADLVLVVLDASNPLEQADRDLLSRVSSTTHIVVLNKCDLGMAVESKGMQSNAIHVSALTGTGIEELRSEIRRKLFPDGENLSGSFVTTARQAEAISKCVDALKKASAALMDGVHHEMILLDLYDALLELNKLTGEVLTEDILGRIFSTFCVGK